MSQAINITLADAQGTPVSHIFNPIGPDKNQVFHWEDPSSPSAIGNWKISLDFKRPASATPGQPSSATRQYRARIVLSEPILETLGTQTISGIPPAPTIAYTNRVVVDFLLPERSTSANRKDLRKMVYNLLNNAMVISAVEDLEGAW